MKVGISFEEETKRGYFGGTKYPPKDYTLAEVALPDYVQRALELTKPVWERYSEVPICVMHDDLGDLELVFMSGFGSHNIKPDFTRHELLTRIAVGVAKKDHNATRNPQALDYSKPTRLSIGVYAGRKFFPRTWEKLPKSSDDSERDSRRRTYVLEEVNVGQEWIDNGSDHFYSDQLGSWSDVDAWTRIGTDGSVLRPRFNDEKTTFYSATTGQLNKENSSATEDDMNVIYDFIGREGRKGKKFILNPGLNRLDVRTDGYHIGSPVRQLLRSFLPHAETRGIPIIGWSNLCCVLPKLPCRDIIEIRGPNRKEGTEFFFSQLLPYLQAWAEDKK